MKALYLLLTLGFAQGNICPDRGKTGLCCWTDLQSCAICSTQCQTPTGSCNIDGGDCSAKKNCYRSLDDKTLPQSEYTIMQGAGQRLAAWQNYLDFFTNPNPDECQLTTCDVRMKTEGWMDTCDKTDTAISLPYTVDSEGGITFDASAAAVTFDEMVCIRCSTTQAINDHLYGQGTDLFRLQITTFSCSAASVTLSPKSTLVPGEYTSFVGNTLELKLPEIKDANCVVSSFSLYQEAVDIAVTELSATVNNYQLVITPTGSVTTATTFKFRIAVIFAAGFTKVYEASSQSVFTWKIVQCDPLHIASVWPSGKSVIQQVPKNAIDTYYELPAFYLTPAECSITTLLVSGSFSAQTDYSFLNQLSSPTETRIAPANPNQDIKLEFFIHFIISDGAHEVFSDKYTLYVGCPGTLLPTFIGYPAGFGADQLVDVNDGANTRYVLPKIDVSSSCSLASVVISDSDTVALQSSSFLTPSFDATLQSYTSQPVDLSLIFKHQFYVWASLAEGGTSKTTQLSLTVGCHSTRASLSIGSFPATFSATQYANIGVASQGFVLPELISSETTHCPVAITKFTTSIINKNALVSDLDTTLGSDGSGNPKAMTTSTITSAQVIIFYIYFSTADEGVHLFSSNMELVIGCISLYGVTVPTIVTTTATLNTGDYYDFLGVTSGNPYCTIEYYSIVQTDMSPETRLTTPTAKPATPNTFQTQFTDIPTTTVSIKIGFKFNEDATVYSYAETISLTFIPVCTSSMTFTFGTDQPPTTLVQTPSEPFMFPTITPASSGCPITFYRISSDPNSYVAHPDMNSPVQLTLGWSTAAADTSILDRTYTFYIQVEAHGGSTQMSPQYTLVVGCPLDLTSVTFTENSFPFSLGRTQVVHIGNEGTMLTHFVINGLTPSPSYCPVTYSVSSTPSTFNSMAGMTITERVVNTLTKTVIVPTDAMTTQTFGFYLAATAGGTTFVSAIGNTLHVGCPSAHYSVTDNNSGTSHTLYLPVASANLPSFFAPITITSSLDVCRHITSIQVSDLFLNGNADSTMIQKDCSPNPGTCLDLVVENIVDLSVSTFRLKFVIGYGSQAWYSPQLTIQVTCNAASSSVSFSGGPYSIQLLYKSTSPAIVPQPTCSNPKCCADPFTYTASSSPSDKTIGESLILGLADGSAPGTIEISGNTDTIQSYSFYLYATNAFSAEGYVQVSVDVVFDCAADSITFSKESPSSAERAQLGSLAMYELQAGGTFKLIAYLKVGDALEADLSNRFSQLAPAGACPISSFRIDKVTDKAGDEVVETTWSKKVRLSSSGLFKVIDSEEELAYKVYVAANNGAIWSDSSSTGAFIDLSISSQHVNLPNVAPKFISLLETVKLQRDTPSSEEEVALPQIYDANGDKFSVEILGSSDFLKYSSSQNSLVVDLRAVVEDRNETLNLKLSDNSGATTLYVIHLELTVSADVAEAIKIEQEAAVQKEEKLTEAVQDQKVFEPPKNLNSPIVSAWIESVDYFGLAKLYFNASMRIDFDKALLKQAQITVITPNEDDDEGEAESLPSVSFAWEPSAYLIETDQLTLLEIQLDFSEPLLISANFERDVLQVDFSGSEVRQLLYAPANQRFLHDDYLVLRSNLRKQMPKTTATETLVEGGESTEVSLKALLLITFTLNVVLSGGLRYTLLLIRALQIVLHLPLVQVRVPANVSSLFQILIPIAMFDVLDPEWTTMLVFTFDEEKQRELRTDMTPQMIDLGYETHSSVLNLGSLSIFAVLYLSEVAVFLVFTLVRNHSRWKLAFLDEMKKRLFFGDLLALLIDANFEFLISSYLQFKHPLYTTGGERFSVFVGWLSLFLTFGFLTFAFARVMLVSLSQLQDEEFSGRWGSVYDEVKTESKVTVAYFPIFSARRIIFLALVFGVTQHFLFQVLGLIFLNVGLFIYLGQFRPLKLRLSMSIELFNEFIVHIVTLHLLFFTDWVSDPVQQYGFGWSMIGLIAVLISFNLIFVFKYGIKQGYLVAQKFFHWAKRKAIALERRYKFHKITKQSLETEGLVLRTDSDLFKREASVIDDALQARSIQLSRAEAMEKGGGLDKFDETTDGLESDLAAPRRLEANINRIDAPIKLDYVKAKEWWPEQVEREQRRKEDRRQKFMNSEKTKQLIYQTFRGKDPTPPGRSPKSEFQETIEPPSPFFDDSPHIYIAQDEWFTTDVDKATYKRIVLGQKPHRSPSVKRKQNRKQKKQKSKV